MYFNEKDLKRKKTISIDESITKLPVDYNNLFHNIRDINNINLKGNLHHHSSTNELVVDIKVNANIIVISALTGDFFPYKFDFLWKEKYNFIDVDSSETNLILEPEGFYLEGYALDEAFMRVPVNLSLKKDREKFEKLNSKMVEDKEDNIDPRWSALKKIKY